MRFSNITFTAVMHVMTWGATESESDDSETGRPSDIVLTPILSLGVAAAEPLTITRHVEYLETPDFYDKSVSFLAKHNAEHFPKDSPAAGDRPDAVLCCT
ncbi:hypothetical protein C8J56DRAFT_958352 [Mycena floridula]|nr:hypothetical protein C8J56DRAFT_958352 [Mycena floridula]